MLCFVQVRMLWTGYILMLKDSVTEGMLENMLHKCSKLVLFDIQSTKSLSQSNVTMFLATYVDVSNFIT